MDALVSINYNCTSEDACMMPMVTSDLSSDPDPMLNVKLLWLDDRTAHMHEANINTCVY